MGAAAVVIIVLVLYLAAFALAVIAASNSRHISVEHSNPTGDTFTCDYKTGLASRLGVAAALILLLAQLIVTIVTRCMCSFHLRRGAARILAVILLILSWLTFLVAELFMVTGSTRGTYEFKQVVSTRSDHCKVVRQVLFGIAAGFTFLTLMLSEGYYLCFLKAKDRLHIPK